MSPDGRWLAYASNQSGLTNEVYVRPFGSAGGGRWQVSTGGGSQPVWAPSGRELFFLDGRARLIAAQVQAGTTFAVGDLVPLFDAARFARDEFHQSYEVTPDGRSFLFALSRRPADGGASTRLVWVDHWFTDLRERLR